MILNSKFIKQASQEFGSQCIVVSIDVKKIGSDYKIFTENGKNCFMKIDVEGHEKEVIFGSQNVLKKNNCFIQVEITNKKKFYKG